MSEKDLMGQEEELDIDALFAKMMADKAASGETVSQSEEEAPVAEELPVVEETPVYEEKPAVEEAPVYEEKPVVKEEAVYEEAPAMEEAPVYEEMPVAEEASKKEDTKKRMFSFGNRIRAIAIIPMLIACIVLEMVCSNLLEDSLMDEVETALQVVAAAADEMYEIGDTDCIDELKEKVGIEIMIYSGEDCVYTTMAGSNQSLDSEVKEKLKEENSVYLDKVKFSGVEYHTYYEKLAHGDGVICVAKDTTRTDKVVLFQSLNIMIVAIILLAIAWFAISRTAKSMISVMITTKEFLSKVADGELTVASDPKFQARCDELGDIYNISVQLQNSLRRIVNNIKVSAADLTVSADQLTGLAQGTKETVDGVYGSLEEITKGSVTQADETGVARQNVDMIGEQITYITEEVDYLTQNAEQMSDAEKASEAIIGELNSSNEETVASVTKVADQINALHDSIESVQSAITMIQNIAEETDLLSLNASIEAARAGDAGRGFAVVALQISKLAEQSNTAAAEVEQIIAEIISESNKMVEVMEVVKVKMDQQKEKLDETMEKSNAVAVGVSRSLDNIESIREKVDVLSESGDAIQDVVHNLASISEQNEASTQNTMSAARGMTDTMDTLELSSERLRLLSERLEDALSIFKI